MTDEFDMDMDVDIDLGKEEIDAIDSNALKNSPEIPDFDSPEWSNYAMSFLEPDEINEINGVNCPSCDGLRRLVGLLVGPIRNVEIIECTPPDNSNSMTATVGVRVEVLISSGLHPLWRACNGEDVTLCVSDIVNVGGYNTKEPYCKHQSATAMTKAEGRVYKKILKLRNVHTAEEVVESTFTNFVDDKKEITDSQIGVIDRLCSRTDIDVLEFINSGEANYDSIKDVPFAKAAKMIQVLNKIQRGTESKEKLIKKYNKNWREK